MKLIRRSFFNYENLAKNFVAIYEVAIHSAGEIFVVTFTEDIIQDGFPYSTKTNVPPFSKREESSIEQATVYFNAYIAELQKRQLKGGWRLMERVDDPKIPLDRVPVSK